MNTVIFAEKPSQARAYAEAFTVQTKTKTDITLAPCSTFPQGATITWGIGHLVELKEPKAYDAKWGRWSLDSLPIVPARYEFQVAKGKNAQFQAVKRHFQKADTIINACDIDREGSNIFYSIFRLTGARPKQILRLWINSLEVDEIRRGFTQLQTNERDLKLYDEARTRQVSDWLVGMNASRIYTLLLQQRGYEDVFPVGRVQSPTVFLVYERMKEIEQFKVEPFFEAVATFQSAQGTYEGKVDGRFKTRQEVERLLHQHAIQPNDEGTITKHTEREKRQLPPLLHSLSTLQATANRKWKMSPAVTLKTAQTLYEKKYISYPRTDSRHITTNEWQYIQQNKERYETLLKQPFEAATMKPSKRYVDNAKVQEHYAIVPTKTVPARTTIEKMKREERLLYEEILRTTLCMFHRPFIYLETSVTTDVKRLPFLSKGKRTLDVGWKELFPQSNNKEDEANILPPLQKGETVRATIQIHEGKTTPPKPYTEGQLITLMKTCGKHIEDEAEVEILKEIEGIGTEATRSSIIETLKTHRYIDVQKNIVQLTDKGRIFCEAIQGTLLASPSMTAKWETYLKKIGAGTGSSEKFLTSMEKFLHHLLATTPDELQRRPFTVAPFVGKKKATKWDRIPIATCPRCQKGKIVQRQSFYGCTHYRQGCKQTFPGTFLKKKLTKTNIKHLCEKGETNVIKGFTSNDGKTFNAKLQFQRGEISLLFEP